MCNIIWMQKAPWGINVIHHMKSFPLKNAFCPFLDWKRFGRASFWILKWE